jgi:Na+-driven multidrug efflux pump
MSGIFSNTAVAAQTIAYNLLVLMLMVPVGLFYGVIVIVGNAVGEGDHKRAKLAAIIGFSYEIIGSGITALLVKLLLRPLGEAYTNDMDVVPVFMNIMPSVFLVLILSGANKGLIGSLRSLQK